MKIISTEYGDLWYLIRNAFDESPVLSMLTPEARKALTAIAVDAIFEEQHERSRV